MAFLSDLHQSFRGSLRNSWSSLVIVLTLGVALGASITIASVIEAVLLRPLPAREQERLRMMWETDIGGERPLVEVSLPNFSDWQQRAQSFDGMAAVAALDWGIVLTSEGPPQNVSFRAVSASFFQTVGVDALVGRTFVPEDDDPGAERVLVVSYGFWQTRLGGDPNAVGRLLSFEDPRGPASFTVAGIMPQTFQFPLGTELWVPAGRQLAEIVRQNAIDPADLRGLGLFLVLGRLADGVEDEVAHAELAAIIAALGEEQSGELSGLHMEALTEFIYGKVRASLWLLSGGVALLLLIACANVSALLLARMLERRRALWVRRALGASFSDLMKLSVLESLVLAALGGLFGLVLAAWALPLVAAIAPAGVPGLDDIRIDGSILIFAGVTVLLCSLAVSVAPLWRLADAGPRGARRPSDAGATTLATLEIGSAVVLLVSAFLVATSFRSLGEENLGFRPNGVLTAAVSPPASRYDKAGRRAFFQRLAARVQEIPGVVYSGAVQVPPLKLGGIGQDAAVRLVGQSEVEGESNPVVNYHQATPGYFRAMGIALVDGRTFAEHEAVPVAIVSQNLAARLWPGETAIGKRLRTRDPDAWLSVVGVVGNARYRELHRARLELYVHYRQADWVTGGLTFTLRTSGDPMGLIDRLAAAVHELDPDQALGDIATMDAVVAEKMAPWRFNAWMASLFASMAALLALVGVFSLLARNVVARSAEFAIRMAVGATSANIVGEVLSRALRWTAWGLIVGIAGAVVMSRSIASILFGVTATDIRVYVIVTASVIVSCVAASLVPALRAANVEPSMLLRTD